MYVCTCIAKNSIKMRFFVIVEEKTTDKFNISLLLFQDICPPGKCHPFMPFVFVLQVSHPLQQSLLKSMTNRKV